MNATPTTKPRLFCFVLMPFDTSFDDVYQFGIKETCEAAGAYCERVDEQSFHERILDRIYNQIAKADLIVADMTGRNPNVFYEVGYAHALGKTTILLTSKADDIPFDLKHFPHIVYGNSLSELRTQLTKRVRWVVENPLKDGEASLEEEIQVFLSGKRLTDKTEIVECATSEADPTLEVSLRNTSSRTVQPGDLKIGFIASCDYEAVQILRIRPVETIQLPDGRLLHMLPDLRTLLPEQYAKATFPFRHKSFQDSVQAEAYCQGAEVVIRLFTTRGTKDFSVVVKSRSQSTLMSKPVSPVPLPTV